MCCTVYFVYMRGIVCFLQTHSTEDVPGAAVEVCLVFFAYSNPPALSFVVLCVLFGSQLPLGVL